MSDDDKKPFVNRHGHRADMNRIDLSDISVEKDGDIDDIPMHSSHGISPQLKPTRKRRTSLRWSRRSALIVGGIIIALLLLPIIAGEVVALRYRSDARAVTGKLNKLISDKVLPSQQKATIKSGVIGQMATGVDDIRSSNCAGGLLDNIAALYPRSKSAYNDCVKKNGELSTLSSGLKKLEAENRYLESALAATKTVTTPLAEPYAVIDAQQTNWVAARDALNKLQPPNEWQAQHKLLVKWAGAVADGWTVLNAASGTQDKAKFEEAEKNLNTGYEGIRNTVDDLLATLHATQENVTAARKSLLN